MGTGASKDGEEVEVNDRYVSQSQSRMGSASGTLSPRPRTERTKSVTSRNIGARMSMSKNAEVTEEPIVGVTRNGFTVPEMTIMEGQSVVFVWQEEDVTVDIMQVIHDGEKLRPVIGGYAGIYSDCNGQYEQQFNLEGEYKFALTGIRCTPLLLTVRRRVDLIAEVTDDGFLPDVIYIDQGHSIKWQWAQCTSPHSVQEVKYEISRACFKKDSDSSANVKTISGSYRQSFARPGLYFFMTQGSELGKHHFCVVHVREAQREYRVEIMDRSYQPMILLIEEGDRVWWSWDKLKCRKHHSVYQIEAPPLEQGDDDPYVPVKDGFRWTTPSKQGLLSHEFFKPGVYHFSDQNFQEAAEYIGTIIVKPKQKEHYVELTETGFNPDLIYAQTGDRIWWTWDGEGCVNTRQPRLFALLETDACLNPNSRKTSAKESEEVFQYLDDTSLALCTKVGMATTNFSTIGVYHYRIADSPASFNSCSVIVNPGPKNHTIHLTDNGFEPKVITVRPNDRVWWVWQSGKKQHNILQVSHQGVPIENGFCSGAGRDAPSAYVHQFSSPGVFYFLSHSLPKIFGAIVVSTQSQVHEVNVGVDLKPDPVTVKINDVVCWIFRGVRQYDVAEVDSIDQVVRNDFENSTVAPRRCMSKAIVKTGVQHFYSKSFSKGKEGRTQNYIDDVKLSSIICDDRFDNAVVRVDKNGFHPAVYYTQKGQSILWTWKGSEDEAHNVIHVKSPDSNEPLNVIHGAKSFNSGKPVPNNSFLYTFDEDGSYTVASQGAPGFFCTIVVMDVGMRVKEPFIEDSVTGGTVDSGTKMLLSCDTPGARIYYTTDGAPAELHMVSVKAYKPEKGIVLRRPGLTFIRAMAVKEGRLNSHIFTSNRFWVLGDEDDDRSVLSEPSHRDMRPKTSAKTWDWWGCVPSIKACFTNPGTLEVFWETAEPGQQSLIKGYQIFLNGVSYCDMFPPNNHSLCVSGLAGGRLYEIVVEVYSNKPGQNSQKSNKLKMRCPLVTPDNGPVVSLERNEKPDALAIVWMSIDTPQNPISGYLVFLNDKQCGARLVPDPESNRCKVVIGSCELEKPYKIYVVALPEDEQQDKDADHVLMSNVLEVVLPLDAVEVRLPPPAARLDEEELYMEYLEVSEGSGYLTAMEKSVSKKRDGHEDHHVESVSRDMSHGTGRPSSGRSSTIMVQHSASKHVPVLAPPAPPRPPSPVEQQKPPILPKESRPPPVIFNATTRDEQRRQLPPDSSSEVDQSRFRDRETEIAAIQSLGKQFRSRSYEEDEYVHGSEGGDKVTASGSGHVANQRSHSHSPIPQEPKKGKLSFRGVGKLAKFAAGRRLKINNVDVNLDLHRKQRTLTFRTVVKVIIGFIRQEKILRFAIGPVKLKQPHKFDLKRLKKFVHCTKAFEEGLSTTKQIELVAPGAVAKPKASGMAQLIIAAKNVQKLKSLGFGGKKGGFVKSASPVAEAPSQEGRESPTAREKGAQFQKDGRRYSSGYDSGRYDYDRERRYPPEYGRPQPPPRGRDYLYPPGRYTPPWYRGSHDDYLRRDTGYETMQSHEYRRGYPEDYYRERDYDRDFHQRQDSVDEDWEDTAREYSKLDHGEQYKRPPQEYMRARRQSSRSPNRRNRSYSPGDERYRQQPEYSPEGYQQSRKETGRRRSPGGRTRSPVGDSTQRSGRSPRDMRRNKEDKGQLPSRERHRSYSPGKDNYRDENNATPEEYRWGHGNERGLVPVHDGYRKDQAFRQAKSFDRGYRDYYGAYYDPRAEAAAKMKSVAVYASAMGGVNDEGGQEPTLSSGEDDQSVMTDDNEKSTQTSSQTGPRVRPALHHDFIPPSLQEKGVSPRGQQRRYDSESETETETETESETDAEEQSMVIMDAQKPVAPPLAAKKSHRTPRTPKTPKSDREFDTPRKRGVSVFREGREYVEVEDGDTTVTEYERALQHPTTSAMYERPSKKRRSMAIIEVQDTVELDAKRNEASMEEERLVTVPAVTKDSMKQIDEGQFITSEGDGILPAPSIMVESHGKVGMRCSWDLPRQPDPEYRLLLYVVNVVGTRFTGDVNSDISFECNLVEKGKQVRGVQHCWNIQDKNTCKISGLVAGLTYRVYVIANYTLVHGQQPCEIQTTSSVIYYTTVGPPRPPKLKCSSVDLHQVLVEWEAPRMHEDLTLKGYQIYVDSKPLGGVRSKETRQMMITNMIPGKTISVYVVAVTKQAVQESDPSRTLHITCPRETPPIVITQQPSYKQGCVLISWDRPKGHTYTTNEEDISLYGVYVDGKWYGEVKANKLGNKHGYQYILNDLNPEQSYDITVKAIAGFKSVDPDAQHLFCLSDGPMSNTLPVMAPAAPKSPKLRLEGLHPEGIDVTWLVPQQHGEAAISGYQMLKDGRLYGSIIPPEVNSLRIRDISLGEKINLQLIALTEHPVGRVNTRGEPIDKDSGIDGSAPPDDKNAEVFVGERYAGCRPGAKLVVHYTGLVCPPSEVWCERVTGHSALVVWNRDDDPKAHFMRPESYQVTWWPGDKPEDEINSDSTSDDHLLITNLRPATSYTVVVEARKMEKYKDVDEESGIGRETISAFILTAKSDNLILKTARPPDAPSNLGVTATTCSAMQLAWDPPREHGVDVIGIRIDAVSLNTGDPHHVAVDAIPDATTAVVSNLREKTDYMIRITAITDEYFDRLPDKHKLKNTRSIPKDTILPADDSAWLPNASILIKTSGTEPPASLKVAKALTSSLKLVWTPPIVYGSNKLQGVIVRWADVKYNKRTEIDDFVIASHVNLLPTEDTLTIEDLMPGNQYKIIVEAIVSVKTSLEKDDSPSGMEKYRRTAHILSRPLYARTRAPTEPPVLLLTGYTQTTAQLYWEKPLLMSVVGKDAEGNPKYLRRYLEGYKLEINGKTYCHLGPSSQSCQLTKCKPGKTYHVTIVALTCTEQGKKERKRKYKGAYKNTNPQDMDYGLLLEDEDNLDSSPSEPLEIMLPKNQDGYIASLDSFFTHNEDRDNKTFGDVKVQWTNQGSDQSLLKQFNVIWYSHDDRVIQTKYVSPDFDKCSIPVTRLKSIYDISMEPSYFTETLPQQPQSIQIMVPGPPDPPEVFLKSSSPEEFVIEWGEPRLYGGVRVRGYQVYLNDKKAGNELSSTHRKAVVPCRPNRYYRVNLVALSANPEYHDSGKSNTLSINTSLNSPREGEALDELTFADDHDIPVKVTKVTETSIHLDWGNFLETEGVGCYKIQWSSVAQPAEREVRLSEKDNNCVINKCLPGTTHFVRLLALDGEGQIKERSKQMTVQTSAPPDGPCLGLRACNFRYIAIQWDKPNTYGDALITGYKVYVNGIVESILNADQLSYTFTHGKWCQEYSFQVQALTAFEKMNSKPSEPLVVEWPGARAPCLQRLATHTSSNLRVGWDDPYLTDGVKLKHFRVCCVESDTEKMVSSISPVHPDTREAEFKHIKKGSYNIYVEVHLYGTSEVVCSDNIELQPAPAPDAPRIATTVVGFDERRQIEKITCDLVNKRDRLIRQVGHKLKQIGALTHPMRAEKDRDVIEGAHTLTRIEELLEDCFSALENYTGQLIAHVSWQCSQSNPDVQVSGYNVLIDGKQYGNSMHEGVKTVRIKLGTDQQLYRLSMVSLTEKPHAASEESNVVDLISETFRPFSFYCYHSIHIKGACWPDQGCCKYQDSIAYERHLAKKLANQGLLKKHVPPPACSLLDVFEGDYKPLLQGHNRQYPTAILFWTPWCLPSQKVISYFTRFARETAREYNFIAVACGTNGSTQLERKDLIHLITANSWREDGTIWHTTSQCASSIYEATDHIWKNTTGGIKRDADIETESNMDITELLGIAGVPTFLFIHQEGYIAWHGRYSAYDYNSFASFMRHTFSEVCGVPCPVFKCDCCKNDTTIDEDTVETVLQFANNQSPLKNPVVKPAVIRPPSPPKEQDTSNERIFFKRKHSPKSKKQNKLSVNQRPYSANSAHSTTYAYLLKSPYMDRQTPSPKTHKVLMRPASSRNVQLAYETL